MPSTDASSPEPDQAPAVPWRQALGFWLQLGCISFGGPAGQIAIMHRELVERRRWISETRFMHALNYCMLLPSPEAQQLATYLGWLMHRTPGGIAAGALFVLPSLVLLIFLSWLYVAWGSQPLVAGVLYGIKPAVAAIVLHALHRLAGRALGDPRRWPVPWALATASFVGLWFFALPFPAVVLGALVLGWGVLARWAPQALRGAAVPAPSAPSVPVVPLASHSATLAPQASAAGVAPGAPAQPRGAVLIDDHTPVPAHARFDRRRLVRVLMAAAVLWLVPMAALHALGSGTLVQMGSFFSQAALVTFGGAYAVLPYVQQAAVLQHGWLSTAQMMDGLALGEATPGPLIMVVAFVGFLGGWQHQVLGPDALFAGAALAACVATWFTFLPSFVFILAGGPWVESTRGQPRLAAPLAAVSCAVVGVIAQLGLWFLLALARPEDASGPVDGWALALVAACGWALWRLRWGVVRVIVLAGTAGLLLRATGLA